MRKESLKGSMTRSLTCLVMVLVVVASMVDEVMVAARSELVIQ